MALLVMTATSIPMLQAQPAHEVGAFRQQEAVVVPPLPATSAVRVEAIAAHDTVHVLADGRVWWLSQGRWSSVGGLPPDARRIARAGNEVLVTGDTWAAALRGMQAERLALPPGTVIVDVAPGARRTLLTRSHLLTHDGGQWRTREVPSGSRAAAQAPDGRVAVIAGDDVHECPQRGRLARASESRSASTRKAGCRPGYRTRPTTRLPPAQV